MKKKEKRKNENNNKITIIILIISILLLVSSITYFVILKVKNNGYDNEVTTLNNNIAKAKNKLKSDETTKDEQDTKLEKLEEELKDNVEELEVWKELKKELQESLS